MRNEERIEIAAAPERVFEWLVDRRLMARWCEALGRPASFADCLPADLAEMRQGYRAEVAGIARKSLTDPARVEVPTTFEVTVYEPPRRYGTRSRHPHAVARELYELEPTGAGTRLRYEREINYKGIARIGMLVAFLPRGGFRRWARDDLRGSLAKLKELAESG